MVNKVGWLRIVEASIAILIILSALIVISEKNEVNVQENYYAGQDVIDKLALNSTIRASILKYDVGAGEEDSENKQIIEVLNKFVMENIPFGLNGSVKICSIEKTCLIGEDKIEINSRERIISSNSSNFEQPRKLVLSVWQE